MISTVKKIKQERELRVKQLWDKEIHIAMGAKCEEDKRINHLNVGGEIIPGKSLISKALRYIIGEFEVKQGAILAEIEWIKE